LGALLGESDTKTKTERERATLSTARLVEDFVANACGSTAYNGYQLGQKRMYA